MSRQDIDAYVESGECFGKAGAYAIQETGDRFIERLEGSFDNVVGFPTELFERYLADFHHRFQEGNEPGGAGPISKGGAEDGHHDAAWRKP
jgi:hypothetical protein